MVDKYGQQGAGAKTELTPEQKAAMQKAQDEAHALVNQQLGWDSVKPEFIAAYADAFTDDELKGLVAFYNSPLGQKLIEKQPAVTEKMGASHPAEDDGRHAPDHAEDQGSQPKPAAVLPSPAAACPRHRSRLPPPAPAAP